MKHVKLILFLGGFFLLSSCQKEHLDIFRDVDCIYKGFLEIQRQEKPEWKAISIKTDDDIPSSEIWGQHERQKEVLIGEYLGLYCPDSYFKNYNPKTLTFSLPKSDGFYVAFPAPFRLGIDKGKVGYDETTVLTPIEKERTKGVKVILRNSSEKDLSDISIIVSKGITSYNVLTEQEGRPQSFKLSSELSKVDHASIKEVIGYVFDVVSPLNLDLNFKDNEDVEYLLNYTDAFSLSSTEHNTYVAEVDLSEAGLEKAGAKKTIRSIRIDGDDIIFPPRGGKMTLAVNAYAVTKVYQHGEVIDSSENTIDYTYSLEGNEDLKITKVNDSLFEVEASSNLTKSDKVKRITITAGGVSRIITITQKAVGFNVGGEIQ